MINIVQIFVDEDIQSDHSYLSESVGKDVHNQSLGICLQNHKEFFTRTDRVSLMRLLQAPLQRVAGTHAQAGLLENPWNDVCFHDEACPPARVTVHHLLNKKWLSKGHEAWPQSNYPRRLATTCCCYQFRQDTSRVVHLCHRASLATLCQARSLLSTRLYLISWPKSTKKGWPIYRMLCTCVLIARSVGMMLFWCLQNLL